VLGFGLWTAGPLNEPDEAAWIFSSYSFRLAFLTPGGLSSPEWKGADALDHPPLAKFLFGAVLAPAGLLPQSSADKQLWFERAFLPYDGAAFVASLRARVPPRALFLARLADSGAFLLACALTALAGAWLIAPEAGALAALLLALSGIVRVCAAQAVSDGLFVALELACALAQAAWAARLVRARRFSPAWSLACGVLAGALFDVKISGLLEIPLLAVTVAAVLAAEPRSKSLRAAALKSALAAAAAAVLSAVALNPSLYREPLQFALAMFAHRRETLDVQRLVYFGGAFQSPLYWLGGAARGLFWPSVGDRAGRMIGALSAALACAGLAGARRRWDAASPAGRVFVLHGAAWTGATLAAFRLDWQHYLLPISPFAALLAAAGARELLARKPETSARLAAIGAAAAALVVFAPGRLTPVNYWRGHPDAYQRAIDAQIPYLLARYPADGDLIRRGEADARVLLEQLRAAP